jgi:hypothetical protein
MRDLSQQRLGAIKGVDPRQFRPQRLDPGGVDRGGVHPAGVEIADLAFFAHGGAGIRPGRGLFQDPADQLLIALAEQRESPPAGVIAGQRMGPVPAAVGELEEVLGRVNRAIQIGQREHRRRQRGFVRLRAPGSPYARGRERH